MPKPTFGDDEMIKPNPNFTQNAIRVTLLPPKRKHKKETTEMTAEEKETQKAIKKQRECVIQAHTVKVMKS